MSEISNLQQQLDYVVYIGRFQPFHIAHQEVIQIALGLAREVIIVIGSAQDERTIKNPFSFDERQNMILASFDMATRARIHCLASIDLYNDQKWTADVKRLVATVANEEQRIGLIGHFKDDSSYYLKLFGEWQLIELENLQQALSATPIRAQYYQGNIEKDKLPTATVEFLIEFQKTGYYVALQDKFIHHDTTPLAMI